MAKDLGVFVVVFVVAFACGFGAGYIMCLHDKPTAACKCGTGVNTGAVIGEVR